MSYLRLAANKASRRLFYSPLINTVPTSRRRRCSTNDANDAWCQSRVAARNEIVLRQTSDAPRASSFVFLFDPLEPE